MRNQVVNNSLVGSNGVFISKPGTVVENYGANAKEVFENEDKRQCSNKLI